MIYLKNITVTRDRKYSQSYGSPEQVNASLGFLNGNWLTFDGERMNTTGKHFHGWTGVEIKESTYKKHVKRIEVERLERINTAKAEQLKEANDQRERIEAAKVKVLARKAWLTSHMTERQMSLNDLGKHKTANLYGFKLAGRFNVKPSDLRSAFKELFR